MGHPKIPESQCVQTVKLGDAEPLHFQELPALADFEAIELVARFTDEFKAASEDAGGWASMNWRIPKLDSEGNPSRIPVLDENGDPELDATGNPMMKDETTVNVDLIVDLILRGVRKVKAELPAVVSLVSEAHVTGDHKDTSEYFMALPLGGLVKCIKATLEANIGDGSHLGEVFAEFKTTPNLQDAVSGVLGGTQTSSTQPGEPQESISAV